MTNKMRHGILQRNHKKFTEIYIKVHYLLKYFLQTKTYSSVDKGVLALIIFAIALASVSSSSIRSTGIIWLTLYTSSLLVAFLSHGGRIPFVERLALAEISGVSSTFTASSVCKDQVYRDNL